MRIDGLCLGLSLGLGRRALSRGGSLWVDDWDLGVLELDTLFALEDGAAFREGSSLVGLLGELALGVVLGERAAVLDELQEGGAVLSADTGGASAEGG